MEDQDIRLLTPTERLDVAAIERAAAEQLQQLDDGFDAGEISADWYDSACWSVRADRDEMLAEFDRKVVARRRVRNGQSIGAWF